ncbi:MAG: 4Fe-4S binding protein [Bacteroidota bacterium]|nr:4Fe-4S binding protein [Bacteroidota bacterium]
MNRTIVKIDEEKCTGCGLCIPNCHEGALQIIDGKARLISDLFCDGLGACIGHCPEDAITLENREAEPYDEKKVMGTIVKHGRNTVLAHLQHLKEHNESELLQQAIEYIKENNIDMSPEGFTLKPSGGHSPFDNLKQARAAQQTTSAGCGGGCPGSRTIDFNIDLKKVEAAAAAIAVDTAVEAHSELRQWPVQLHLVNPAASYFRNADVVLSADCVAYSMGNFHSYFLKGKSLAIACPKLDTNKEVYVEKLARMISESGINTLTVVMMEVPCCGGLMGMAQMALQRADRKVPVKQVVINIQGEIITEEWV